MIFTCKKLDDFGIDGITLFVGWDTADGDRLPPMDAAGDFMHFFSEDATGEALPLLCEISLR